MADTITPHYNFTKPEDGGSNATWGAKTNNNWDLVDTTLKAISDASLTQARLEAAAAKTTPVDADVMLGLDSAASNVLSRFTWASIKSTLATYFQPSFDAKVPNTRFLTAGTGLSGLGDLSADRSVSVDIADNAQALAGTSNIVMMTPLRVGEVANDRAMKVVANWSHSSNVDNIDFTNLGDYIHLVVLLDQLSISSSDALVMRTSTNNGSSFDVTDYLSAAANDATGIGSLTGFRLRDGSSSDICESGQLDLYGFNKSNIATMCHGLTYIDLLNKVTGRRSIKEVNNAIRITTYGSAQITGGEVYILGQKG